MGGISMTLNARPVLITSKEVSEFEGKQFYKVTFVDIEDRKQYNASCKDDDMYSLIQDMAPNNLILQLTQNKYGMKFTVIGIEQ